MSTPHADEGLPWAWDHSFTIVERNLGKYLSFCPLMNITTAIENQPPTAMTISNPVETTSPTRDFDTQDVTGSSCPPPPPTVARSESRGPLTPPIPPRRHRPL